MDFSVPFNMLTPTGWLELSLIMSLLLFPFIKFIIFCWWFAKLLETIASASSRVLNVDDAGIGGDLIPVGDPVASWLVRHGAGIAVKHCTGKQ